MQIVDRYRNKLVVMNTIELAQPIDVAGGATELTFAVDAFHLAAGSYSVNVLMGNTSELYDNVSEAFMLEAAQERIAKRSFPVAIRW